MDARTRKSIDYIREGLLLVQQEKLKIRGNPYASLNLEIDHKELNCDAKIVFEHLDKMGVLK